MTSRDFDYLTLRNVTAYNPNRSYVSSSYVLSVGPTGRGIWTNQLLLSSLSVSSINNSTITAGTVGPTGTVGLHGVTGSIGYAGWNGNDGSYGITGNNNVLGTDGLHGENGALGIQGSIGTNGSIGANGIQGSVGTLGPLGAKGPNGLISQVGTCYSDYLFWDTFVGIDVGSSQVHLGCNAGQQNQYPSTIAIGNNAGQNAQGTLSIAVGNQAGQSILAGAFPQYENAIAIGNQAGQGYQWPSTIAIGNQAGIFSEGTNSISIGYLANGPSNQSTNTIVINASGNGGIQTVASSGLYLSSIRSSAGGNRLLYNGATREVVVSNTKTFVVPHPTDSDRHLVHACLEGPEVGVYYRGIGEIPPNRSSVPISLPPYAASMAHSFTVHITPLFTGAKRSTIYETSVVTDGVFMVYGDPGRFYWHVYGKRSDVVTAPHKSDVHVHGDGPYKWIG